MKSIYFVAGLFVMLVQGSWQRSLHDTEEKSSLFPAPHADSLNDLHQIHKEKRNDEESSLSEKEERILSEFDEFMQSDCLENFLLWLMKNSEPEELPAMVRRRHVDGSFSDEMNTVHDNLPTQEHLK